MKIDIFIITIVEYLKEKDHCLRCSRSRPCFCSGCPQRGGHLLFRKFMFCYKIHLAGLSFLNCLVIFMHLKHTIIDVRRYLSFIPPLSEVVFLSSLQENVSK